MINSHILLDLMGPIHSASSLIKSNADWLVRMPSQFDFHTLVLASEVSLGIPFKCGKATFIVAAFLSAESDIFWRDRCVLFLCGNTWKSSLLRVRDSTVPGT